jgi:hypothetical protein
MAREDAQERTFYTRLVSSPLIPHAPPPNSRWAGGVKFLYLLYAYNSHHPGEKIFPMELPPWHYGFCEKDFIVKNRTGVLCSLTTHPVMSCVKCERINADNKNKEIFPGMAYHNYLLS